MDPPIPASRDMAADHAATLFYIAIVAGAVTLIAWLALGHTEEALARTASTRAPTTTTAAAATTGRAAGSTSRTIPSAFWIPRTSRSCRSRSGRSPGGRRRRACPDDGRVENGHSSPMPVSARWRSTSWATSPGSCATPIAVMRGRSALLAACRRATRIASAFDTPCLAATLTNAWSSSGSRYSVVLFIPHTVYHLR